MVPDICTDSSRPQKLLAQAQTNPENEKKRDDRKKLCRKPPPDPACKADGHGAPATQAEKLLRASTSAAPYRESRYSSTKDVESDFRALTISCDQFMPPITGATT